MEKKTWSHEIWRRKHGARKHGEENMRRKHGAMKYSNIPPQTHGGLRETILSLEVKTRKGLGERGLVKISASWS